MWFQSSKAIILDYMLLEVGTMRKRSKVSVIVAIAVIIAGAGAFYLVSPLFISTQVNEPLPTSVLQSESYQRFISMNEEEKAGSKANEFPRKRYNNDCSSKDK